MHLFSVTSKYHRGNVSSHRPAFLGSVHMSLERPLIQRCMHSFSDKKLLVLPLQPPNVNSTHSSLAWSKCQRLKLPRQGPGWTSSKQVSVFSGKMQTVSHSSNVVNLFLLPRQLPYKNGSHCFVMELWYQTSSAPVHGPSTRGR